MTSEQQSAHKKSSSESSEDDLSSLSELEISTTKFPCKKVSVFSDELKMLADAEKKLKKNPHKNENEF